MSEYGGGGRAEVLHQLTSGDLLLGPVAAGVQPPPLHGDAEAALALAVPMATVVVVVVAMTLLLPPPSQAQQSRQQSTQLHPTTRALTSRSSYPSTCWTATLAPHLRIWAASGGARA